MTTFEVLGRHFYSDGRLFEQIKTKVIPDLLRKDMDRVYIVDGRERSGKSVLTQTLAAVFLLHLNTRFDITNICMSPNEFRNKIMNASKNQIVIYDEAHRGMGSTTALSEINKILTDLMMEMGQKNLCVFIVLPCFFLLKKYVAVFRSQGLFHVYMKGSKRGYWVYFNEENKKVLYLRGRKELNYNCVRWPHFRGRFMENYLVDEKEYRKKKGKCFSKQTYSTREEGYKKDRDACVKFLYDNLPFSIDQICTMLSYYGFPISKGGIINIMKGLGDEEE